MQRTLHSADSLTTGPASEPARNFHNPRLGGF